MSRGVRWFLIGGVALVALAGCGKSYLQYAQREPWRREAEVACLGSGTIRESVSIVRVEPIDGPGICGADFPLKVAALGESAAIGYADEVVRPPGSIPGGAQQPRWPVNEPQYRPPQQVAPVTRAPLPAEPQPQLRWQRGPDPYQAPRAAEPQYRPAPEPQYRPAAEPQYRAPPEPPYRPPQQVEPVYRAPAPASRYEPPRAEPPRYEPPRQVGSPMSINPPGVDPNGNTPPEYYPQRNAPPPQADPPAAPNARAPQARQTAPAESDEEELPPYARPGAPPLRQSSPPPSSRPLPALGPRRGPPVAATPVDVKPTATLACPIVSALDRWIINAVQPAAQKWFGQPVVEIRQISAYSCRGMNGQPGARISEHAFGNALDIAAFVLANGHRITVKDGWRGSPEEQGFLRDVQAAACDQFTTVLAPGSNQFHYDHIHVDLMRRDSGRRICNPGAVDGEVVAARARKNPALAARSFEPPPTRRYDPPIEAGNDPFAWRGDARRDPDTTSSIGGRKVARPVKAEEDLDWVEEPGPRPSIDWSDRHKVR